MKFLFSIFFICTVSSCFSQSDFTAKDYPFFTKIPAGWDQMEGEAYDPLTLIYQYDPEGKARLAVSFNVTVAKASHDGDLELMAINYRKELYSRAEFENEKITSDQVVQFCGMDVIEIYGAAKVKALNQKLKWKMYLFEYKGLYYELSFVGSKSDFKKKDVQAGFDIIESNFKLL